MTETPMTTKCDPKALEVARAVARVADEGSAVILFGSRARGDYHELSDVDIMLVTGDSRLPRVRRRRLRAVADARADELYGCLTPVDVVAFTADEFNHYKQSRNHVAGQAVRQGINMSGEPINYTPGPDDPQSDWPDVNQRILNTRRNLRTMTILVNSEADEEDIGLHAQQVLENALKGYISALGAEYRSIHELNGLTAIVRRHPSEDGIDAADRLDWLSAYAVEYKYKGLIEPIADPHALLTEVARVAGIIIERIHYLTGTSPDDVVNARRREP